MILRKLFGKKARAVTAPAVSDKISAPTAEAVCAEITENVSSISPGIFAHPCLEAALYHESVMRALVLKDSPAAIGCAYNAASQFIKCCLQFLVIKGDAVPRATNSIPVLAKQAKAVGATFSEDLFQRLMECADTPESLHPWSGCASITRADMLKLSVVSLDLFLYINALYNGAVQVDPEEISEVKI